MRSGGTTARRCEVTESFKIITKSSDEEFVEVETKFSYDDATFVIHRAYREGINCKEWSCSEYRTGLLVTIGYSVEAVKQKAIEKLQIARKRLGTDYLVSAIKRNKILNTG